MTIRAADPWLVALDVDGTLMHDNESVDADVIRAVQAARDRGHHVMLATGRAWTATLPVLRLLDLMPEYVVSANGAITLQRDPAATDGYRRIHEETFDPALILAHIRGYLPDGKFMVELPDGRRLHTPGLPDWNLDQAREATFDEMMQQRASRVVATSTDHELSDFFRLVDDMGLHHVVYAVGQIAWLDLAPEGVNKATALERVRGWLGHPVHRVLAIGDGRNDIEMFRWAATAGRAVAMGQALPEVRAAATEVTGTIDECGAVPVLDSLP